MKKTKIIMGMPVTLEIVGEVSDSIFDRVFDYFEYVDFTFSTYRADSEISLINSGVIKRQNLSRDMREIFALALDTKRQTGGVFDIVNKGKIDPSGIVKGWAIAQAAGILKSLGVGNFYIDCGGDIAVSGKNSQGKKWRVGIRNPFNKQEIVKILSVNSEGVATSGTYERGAHIYNPKTGTTDDVILSLTVIGPNIYEADRFATAAFAMGRGGIAFIENLNGFEGYMIDKEGMATYTSGFSSFTCES